MQAIINLEGDNDNESNDNLDSDGEDFVPTEVERPKSGAIIAGNGSGSSPSSSSRTLFLIIAILSCCIGCCCLISGLINFNKPNYEGGSSDRFVRL